LIYFWRKTSLTPAKPLVAVVILNWNGLRFLQQFLPGVLQTRYQALQIVVADNASADGSVEWLRQHHPQVHIIKNPGNEGFARGYNLALQQVKADYYVLLNSDVEVTPDWVDPVIELMERQPEIAACQPKILSWHQKSQFEYAGAAGGWIDRYGFPFARGRVMDHCEADESQYEDAAPVFWATGAALFIKAAAYHEVGGLDDYFFAHQEEIDLCWRLQRAGHRVYVCPQSVVYHVGGGTLPQGNPRKTFLNFRNNLIMLSKNLHPAERYGKLFLRLMLDGVAGIRFLLKGDFKSCWAVFRSHLQFYYWSWTKKQNNTLPYKRMRQLEGTTSKNLVWAYFVKKKQTFRQVVGE
jgi:GT2 family glycosyltransferase